MDGATLAEAMRQRGINMRYLGKVLDLVLRSPARDQLDHIYVSGAWAGGSCWLQLEVWTCPRLGSLTSLENRYWRTHHTLRQAHLQDISTGAATLPKLVGPPWVAWAPEKSPGWGPRAILTSVKTWLREWSSQASQPPSATS